MSTSPASKSKYLGKKGYLTNLFSSLKEIAPENRRSYKITNKEY